MTDAKSGKATLSVTSDLHTDDAASVQWALTDLVGRALEGGKVAVIVQQNTNQIVAELDLHDALETHGERNVVLWFSLVIRGQMVSENVELFVRPKHVELLPPNMTIHTEHAIDGGYDVTLTAEAVALYVWLELADAQLSDNFFHLRPNVPKVIHVTAEDVSNLVVHSLHETYTS